MTIEDAKAVLNDFLTSGEGCARTKDEIREALLTAMDSMEQLERLLWAYMGAKMFGGKNDKRESD